jgi:hypothetical protein
MMGMEQEKYPKKEQTKSENSIMSTLIDDALLFVQSLYAQNMSLYEIELICRLKRFPIYLFEEFPTTETTMAETPKIEAPKVESAKTEELKKEELTRENSTSIDHALLFVQAIHAQKTMSLYEIEQIFRRDKLPIYLFCERSNSE